MLWLIKQIFVRLLCFSRSLTRFINTPGHAKCVSLNNQQCLTQPTLTDLHLDEYIKGLH